MDRLFEDSFVRPRGWVGSAFEGYGLPLDVTSGPDDVTVEASLPGFKPEDVEVTVENGTLCIHAESRSEQSEGEGESLVTEIRRGSVSRTITPADRAGAGQGDRDLRAGHPEAADPEG